MQILSKIVVAVTVFGLVMVGCAGLADDAPGLADSTILTTPPIVINSTVAPVPAVSSVVSAPSPNSTISAATTVTPIDAATIADDIVIDIDTRLEPVVRGDEGEPVEALQQKLLDLGFWHYGVDGIYGNTTEQAVMAYQKYVGLPATGQADLETVTRLEATTTGVQSPTDATITVDLSEQLAYIKRSGETMVLNVSTGSGETYTESDQNSSGTINGVAETRLGAFEFYMERDPAGGWWVGDLGGMYRPKYFDGGIAVHGASNVPNYPASHGCVRVTPEAMDWLWVSDIGVGDTIIVQQ